MEMVSQAPPPPPMPGNGTSQLAELNRAGKAMIGQLAEIRTRPDGPFRKQPMPGYRRGIDFYEGKELVLVAAAGALLYHRIHGVYPQLVDPRRMSEKIFWAKLFRPMKIPEAGNKLLVSDLLSNQARSMISVPEVAWRSPTARLPASTEINPGTYYLKTNHGSDMFRRIEWPPSDADRQQLEELFAGYLRNDFGYRGGEWWYLCFRREIFLERSVTNDPDSIAWYCYTFGGSVARIIAFRKTAEGPHSFWLNPDFTPIERQSASKPRTQFALPSAAIRTQMVEAASQIGRRFSFVRADFLLSEDEQLYLSELTFSPGNGWMRWPSDMDLQMGALWDHETEPQF